MPANALAPEPRNAMLRPYEPTLRERIAAYFMGDTRPSPERRQFATGIADILSYLPGTGNVIQGEEAYRRGDNKGAILAALPIPGAANVAARAEQEAVKRGIRAFHGSPHDFPAFDFSKMGTGTGVQARGRGGYFSADEAGAQSYRDMLSNDDILLDGKLLFDREGNTVGTTGDDYIDDIIGGHAGDVDAAIRQYEIHKENSLNVGLTNTSHYDDIIKKLNNLKGRISRAGNKGHMYEVNINADPEHFIDWDKSLEEQTPFVRERLQQKYPDYFITDKSKTLKGSDIVRPVKTGREKFASDIAAAKNLQGLGIPGVTYSDAGALSAGEGSRNYVVFDDKIVEIMRKYGLMGPIGAGIAAKILERQQQRQEM
jgi:hypothetical protein